MIETRPILIIALVTALIFEIVLMLMVYSQIGGARLPYQIARLIFQIVLSLIIVFYNSKGTIFVLTGYHIFAGLQNLASIETNGIIALGFFTFHISIALLIYLHKWFDKTLFSVKNKD